MWKFFKEVFNFGYRSLEQKSNLIKTIKDKIEELTKKVMELMELIKTSSNNI
jgi:hypothetical protein